MPENKNRLERIDEEYRREISQIISLELKNPNVTGLISVTKVNPIRSYLLECLSFKNLIKNLYLVLPVNIASFYYYIINETIKIMASLALLKK